MGRIRVLDDTLVDQIAAGRDHTCALSHTGEVFCWGRNQLGQLGQGNTQTLTGIVQVELSATDALVAAGNTTCALSQGRVLCWGANDQGQIGASNTVDGFADEPQAVLTDTSTLKQVSSITLGPTHGCARVNATRVYCWGSNASGAFALEQPTQSSVAIVSGFGDSDSVEAGREFTCVLRSGSGALECAGLGTSGQLGDGSGTSDHQPQRPFSLSQPTTLFLGESHACALLAGDAWCWGASSAGQTGQGLSTPLLSPAQVTW